MPMYVDEGKSIITNSMLSTFLRCPKQTEYKYYHRLKPKLLGSPLKRGKWVHDLLEEDAKGGDWLALHKKYSRQFEEMFDEEKDYYGDMPTEILRIMKSYFWHYKHDPWKYHEAELELEMTLPNGQVLRGKIDALIENQFGLWLVDHKTHKTLPGLQYRILDTQSPRYLLLAKANKIPVMGFIWNYVRWKAPTVPVLLKDGSRISKRAVDTDYPTLRKALKRYELDPAPYSDMLARLKAQRYAPGEAQTSSFFLRSVMEKDKEMLKRMKKATQVTGNRLDAYDFSDPDFVERNTGRHCEFMCSYTALCGAELMGLNTKPLIKQNYRVGDPMSYYHDKAGDIEGKEDL